MGITFQLTDFGQFGFQLFYIFLLQLRPFFPFLLKNEAIKSFFQLGTAITFLEHATMIDFVCLPSNSSRCR